MSVSSDAQAAPAVDVVPLGGLGEFGLNMLAVSCGETTILIDAGSMFPEADLPAWTWSSRRSTTSTSAAAAWRRWS